MSEGKRTDEIQGAIVHEYDGIEEADNQLPRWWLGVFILTSVFAAGYWFYYEKFALAPGPAEQLRRELAGLRANSKDVGASELEALVRDPAKLALGKTAFTTNCVVCHEVQGQGKIGPNLTDKFWIHGGTPEAIVKVISDGVLDKGMPAWGPVLGPDGVKQVSAYVLSLRNTNVAGKEPQGEELSAP